MNLFDEKYSRYALVREMMEAVGAVRDFDTKQTAKVAERIRKVGRVLLAGEGSSRIFPAKNARRKAMEAGLDICIETEGARQAGLYDLSKHVVFCTSNSGRTREVVELAKRLTSEGHEDCYAMTAKGGTVLEEVCGKEKTFVLSCGAEQAVAATKSVIEQGLFYESIIRHIMGRDVSGDMAGLAKRIKEVLTMRIDKGIVEAAANAGTIYFAGYNDGVAEELRLKTNEITRKKSDYLEGTYAVHGIEEVMDKGDVVFVVDPIKEEIEKFRDVLVDGVGLRVVAIADRDTPFETIRLPKYGKLGQYVQLCAGWNLLVEIGLHLGVDLDKPARARKVGNELF